MRAEYERENPQNAAAFAAAYREVVDILKSDDAVWVEGGRSLNLAPEALVLFRDQVRGDILRTFTPDMNGALSRTFDIVKGELGAEALGFETMPAELLTLRYQ